MSNGKYLGIWVPVIAFLIILTVVANVAISIFGSWVNTQLGEGTYTIETAEGTEDWDTDYNEASYDSLESEQEDAFALVEEIESEGVVLAKNEAAALPLASGAKVTLLGRFSADPVFGGAGSGSVDTSTAVNAITGLENAGFDVNPTAYAMFESFAADAPKADIVMDDPAGSTYVIGEMPVDQYTDEATASFADYADAAVVVIGRGGGEGGDLAQDMTDVPGAADERAQAGEHMLELNQDEKAMLEVAKASFDTVIVVVNASTSMEMGVIQDDPEIDGVLLIGSPGQTGYNAVGDVLSGAVNPSGRTVDTWSADFTQDPTWSNFGNFQYSNVDSVNGPGYFVQYEEGIYVGYRYYETAAAEGFIDYDSAVVYPFGYGLSYTDFSWEIAGEELGGTDGDITVDVTVTNTGDVAGKDVVELYYNAPYTAGGIEKAEVVLGAFEKTSLLEPGQSETVTLTLAVEDMASYDYETAGAYVLEAGDYELRVQTDSHTLAEGVEPISYTVGDTIVYGEDNPRESDGVAATNQFDDVSALFSDTAEDGKIVNLSRADFAGTWPTAPTEADLTATDEIVAAFDAYDAAAAAEASDAEMPVTGAENGLQLIDLRGLDFDHPLWEDMLDQLTVEEITKVILNGAYNTDAIESVVKPATVDLDGPAGFSSFLNDAYNGTAYPSEVVIAQTWNKEIAHRMGAQVGEEALQMGANGWYAPALNIHRSPFAGRNFEYYSEDPVLSGEMAKATSEGALTKGVYTFLKHFAMNDQETNRVNNGVASWANEQAIREIYLKAFEIPVKEVTGEISYISDDEGTVETAEVGQMAMMSSFNRIGSTWAGGSKALMTDVLRDEWGFEGFVITDFNLYGYMYPDQAIDAGTDHMLTFEPFKVLEDTTSALAVSNLRTVAHHMLFTVANSNAMDGIAPASTITYTPPAWQMWRWVITGGVGLIIAGLIAMVVVRVRRRTAGAPEAEVTEPVAETVDA
ncbi:glycoside hydrolase family 3 C-terminal domain-containing protein [Demequina sp. SYSU T00039]|uniref:Glycoside hydrolase family 3 C-terminal domain-containing protein n=1 Tax=Demequina lignilytica TaxID=3051663 RepID=A0AAW7M5B5_9MICO|nr:MULTISPECIES: glycoside hydrolase family 3 N-terminal domain-containing protein [unclassified Demequina]MDN4478940.1 glycoside hydrolase family 3 C-terminal domain-containing protein [Demequina sp. SYSU T00039-1]MDN4488815.1 glycoside hydrolase family 3 C-terminal domain-containing protein [Demequina sp. SYSU T00039]MDN4491472.1 glycoside hydrolase family 3 C-terminal domain-containing protein [Demequina sp. SYSU T00068]